MAIELTLFDPARSYVGQKQFDCNHEVINAFVRNSLKPQVKKNLSVAYVLTDTDRDNRFIAFYTVAQHMVDVAALSELQLGSLPRKIPCSRLVMLAVDSAYKGQKLGSMLMRHALKLTQQVAQQVGSFGLYLDADPHALGFNQALGFRLLSDDQSPNPSPMFLPLSAIADGACKSGEN